MAIVKTEGVVIKYQKFRETSLILTFYTRDLGRLKALAKGARGKKSKFQSGLDLFACGQLVAYVKEDRDLQLLSDFDVTRSFQKIQEDLVRFAHAGAAGELLEVLVAGQESNPGLFDLLVGFLGLLERAPAAALPGLFRSYQLKTSALLGYRPELDRCVGCGKARGPMRFSPQMGGVVCVACAATSYGTAPLSDRALETFRRLCDRPLSEVAAAGVSAEREIGPILDAFLQYHVDRYRGIRSLQFLRKLGPARA